MLSTGGGSGKNHINCNRHFAKALGVSETVSARSCPAARDLFAYVMNKILKLSYKWTNSAKSVNQISGLCVLGSVCWLITGLRVSCLDMAPVVTLSKRSTLDINI